MTFQNSILSGTTLVRAAIQSEGFQAGVQGWSIERDGDAFFNSVSMRGTWRVQNASSGNSYMEGGITGNIPYLKWNGVGTSFIAEKFSSSNLIIGPEPISGHTAILNFTPARIIMAVGDTKEAVIFDTADGFLKAGEYFPLVTYTWVNIPALGAGRSGTVDYKLLPTGEVIFRGSVTGGTNSTGTQIINTMPVGYRPTVSVRVHAPRGDDGDAVGFVQMNTAGQLVIAHPHVGSSSYWLNNLRYSVI